jgi:hypothetical protein
LDGDGEEELDWTRSGLHQMTTKWSEELLIDDHALFVFVWRAASLPVLTKIEKKNSKARIISTVIIAPSHLGLTRQIRHR